MFQLRFFFLVAVVSLISTRQSIAGVSIVSSSYSVETRVFGEDSDGMHGGGPGSFSLEASSGHLRGQAQALLNGVVDPNGTSIVGLGAAGVMTHADQYVANAFSRMMVQFTLDTAYQFSFLGTLIESQFIESIAQLQSDGASGPFLANTSSPFAFSGVLQPGTYYFNASSGGFVTEGHALEPFQGSFEVNLSLTPLESPVIPEPASLAVWSCLGLTAIGGAWWRKRRLT